MNPDPTTIQPGNRRGSQSRNHRCGQALENEEIRMRKCERMPKLEYPMSLNGVEPGGSDFGPLGFFRYFSFIICHLNRGQTLTSSVDTVPEGKRSSRSRGQRAFSLIELIGVLAVMAILAAAIVPAVIRQMDKIAGDQESAALKSFSDALQQSIMRNRYIP